MNIVQRDVIGITFADQMNDRVFVLIIDDDQTKNAFVTLRRLVHFRFEQNVQGDLLSDFEDRRGGGGLSSQIVDHQVRLIRIVRRGL